MHGESALVTCLLNHVHISVLHTRYCSGCLFLYLLNSIAPATITAAPQSQTVTLSQPVSFSCEATGTPLPSIMWYKLGEPITSGVTNISLVSGVQSNLTISSVQQTDAGTYQCVVTNVVGSPFQTVSVNSSAELVVLGGKKWVICRLPHVGRSE